MGTKQKHPKLGNFLRILLPAILFFLASCSAGGGSSAGGGGGGNNAGGGGSGSGSGNNPPPAAIFSIVNNTTQDLWIQSNAPTESLVHISAQKTYYYTTIPNTTRQMARS